MTGKNGRAGSWHTAQCLSGSVTAWGSAQQVRRGSGLAGGGLMGITERPESSTSGGGWGAGGEIRDDGGGLKRGRGGRWRQIGKIRDKADVHVPMQNGNRGGDHQTCRWWDGPDRSWWTERCCNVSNSAACGKCWCSGRRRREGSGMGGPLTNVQCPHMTCKRQKKKGGGIIQAQKETAEERMDKWGSLDTDCRRTSR